MIIDPPVDISGADFISECDAALVFNAGLGFALSGPRSGTEPASPAESHRTPSRPIASRHRSTSSPSSDSARSASRCNRPGAKRLSRLLRAPLPFPPSITKRIGQ